MDWWTLGVLLYEMLTGLPPFYDENTNEMYRKILTEPLRFPDSVRPEARSLLTGLLNRDPRQRLGVNGAQDIKNHPFFAKHINFTKLWNKQIQPPFKPAVASAIDTSNFDEEFTNEVPLDSVVDDSHLSQTVQQQLCVPSLMLFSLCLLTQGIARGSLGVFLPLANLLDGIR